MIKILLISPHVKKGMIGGAEKSFINIADGLKTNKDFQVETYFGSVKNIIKRTLGRLGIGYYLLIPKIIILIKKYKPDIIITQTRISFATIISALVYRVPVINIIRDTSDMCPKNADVINYGEGCPGLVNKKICYKCINYWRTLRILIGNKPRGWQYSLNSSLSTILYKTKYFLCKFTLFLINHAIINLVASDLMKNIVSENVNPNKILVKNITPIRDTNIVISPIKKKTQLLFIIPSYEASYKGLDFVLKLSQFIPEDYKIVIVGGIIPIDKIKDKYSRIINYGRVETKELNLLYQNSVITLVPSFSTEAFGRVVIESILNKTQVITSQNCGVNSFFKNDEFLKVLPIKLDLWIKQIKDMIEKPIKITDDDIYEVSSKFSMEEFIKEFSMLIKKITE